MIDDTIIDNDEFDDDGFEDEEIDEISTDDVPSSQQRRSRRVGGGVPGKGPQRRQRSSFGRRQKVCDFCIDRNVKINYKDYQILRRYLTGHGKIRPRRQTGTCARHQRALAREVKRARHIALLPFVGGDID